MAPSDFVNGIKNKAMIWEKCQGEKHIGPLRGRLYRLVESQEQVATLGYVDTLEEQALLEEMLESVKPAYQQDSDRYHYLLKPPFRYPPLPWGSRFGRVHEPGLFYGGCNRRAALAESAYYRFVFWWSMDTAPPKERIRSEHTLFSVSYRTMQGIRLQAPPFDRYQNELAHPAHYQQAQLLGTSMRDAGVDAFEYPSARDPDKGYCVGLFSPAAFTRKRPENSSQWLCELSAGEVLFKQNGVSTIYRFALKVFLVDGELPVPA